jgi:hypothetical protein
MKLKSYGRLYLIAYLWGGAAAWAQQPAVPSTSGQAPVEGGIMQEESMAFVRIWHMVPGSQGVKIAALVPGEEAPRILVQKPPASFYCGYRDLKPGSNKIQVLSLRQPPEILAQTEALFGKKGFYTILVSSKGKGYSIQVIDDTVRMPEEKEGVAIESLPPPQLKLYQFIEGAEVVVQAIEAGRQAPLEFGKMVEFKGLAPGVLTLKLDCKEAKGVIETQTDVSLSAGSSYSLIVIRDIYGRFSPRVLPNGRLE